MSEKAEIDDARSLGSVGLCEHCRHVRVMRSDRDSVSHLCSLPAVDPNVSEVSEAAGFVLFGI